MAWLRPWLHPWLHMWLLSVIANKPQCVSLPPWLSLAGSGVEVSVSGLGLPGLISESGWGIYICMCVLRPSRPEWRRTVWPTDWQTSDWCYIGPSPTPLPNPITKITALHITQWFLLFFTFSSTEGSGFIISARNPQHRSHVYTNDLWKSPVYIRLAQEGLLGITDKKVGVVLGTVGLTSRGIPGQNPVSRFRVLTAQWPHYWQTLWCYHATINKCKVLSSLKHLCTFWDTLHARNHLSIAWFPLRIYFGF